MSQDDGTNRLDWSYSAGGKLIGFKLNGEANYYYLRNLQGDVIGIYDSDGEIVCRYTYNTWGYMQNIFDENGNTNYDTTHIANINPIRYRGYYFDRESDFYYLQSRYYSPEICRFINADALFVAGDSLAGSNMFAYCGNNPVMYCDPTGYAEDVAIEPTLIDYAVAAILLFIFSPIIFAKQIAFDEILAEATQGLSALTRSAVEALALALAKVFGIALNPAQAAHNDINDASNEYPDAYWEAIYINDGTNEYVQRGKTLTFEEAKTAVNNNKNVLAGSYEAAKKLSEEFGNSTYELDKDVRAGYNKNGKCYYFHFHPKGGHGAPHIWFWKWN